MVGPWEQDYKITFAVQHEHSKHIVPNIVFSSLKQSTLDTSGATKANGSFYVNLNRDSLIFLLFFFFFQVKEIHKRRRKAK